MKVPRLWPRTALQRSAIRKWSRRALIAIGLYMIYPLTVTLALATGLIEKLVASEDLRVEIEAPAWSLLPGDMHLGKVKVFMNGDTQFILSADNVTAQVRLLPLLRRRFEVASLEANNVIYHMRVQVDDPEVDSPRTRAFPPLPDLPGDPTKSKQKAEQTEERDPSWSVRIEGIDAEVRELWFFEYRYLGPGHLKGGFERSPEMMRVDTSVQDLGPGALRFGADQIISKNFQGQIEVEIPELDPRGHADTSFFEFVEGAVRLRADFDDLSHLSAYIPGHPAVSGGAGPLSLQARMNRGVLAQDTRVSYETSELGLKGYGYGIQMDWKLLIDMGDEPEQEAKPRPHVQSTSESTYVSFSVPGENPFTIQVHGRKETGILDSARVGRAELEAARIEWPQIVTVDIDDLGRLASATQSVKTIEGRATGSLTLTLDEQKRMRGPVSAKWEGVTMDVQKMRARLNGQLDFNLTVDLPRDRAEIAGLKSTLRGGRFQVGSEQVEGYWLNLHSDRVRFGGLPADFVSGDLSISARDAEPVIRGFAADGKIPSIVADIVKLRNLKVIAKLRKKQKALDVMLDTVESDLVDFSGRIFQGPKDSRVALLIGGKTVSLGIDKHGDHTGFEAFAGAEWLNERLRHFPKPLEQVEGQKP